MDTHLRCHATGSRTPQYLRRSAYGEVGSPESADGAWKTILESAGGFSDRAIKVPALALYAAPRSAYDAPPWLRTQDPKRRQTIEKAYRIGVRDRIRAIEVFRRNVTNNRVVEIPGADHFIFLSNEADVLRELQSFLKGLP